MNKLSKLQALLGEDQVAAGVEADDSPWTHYPKPKHLYEGTDSEDDEDIMRAGKQAAQAAGSSWQSDAETPRMTDDRQLTKVAEYELQMGQLATEGESFCSWQLIKKYPYAYIGNANRNKVAARFWDEGKLFNWPWDFFYIHHYISDNSLPALLLIPTKQFEAFLAIINRTLKTQLAIPSDGGNRSFQVTFENDGTPQPRFLGRSTSKEMAENLRCAIPSASFRAKGEPATAPNPSDRSLAAFKAKIDLMLQTQKGKKVKNKEKQKTERIAKQQSWGRSTKRVQRYLGIRQASHEKQSAAARAGLGNSEFEWSDHDAAVKDSISRTVDFKHDQLVPYEQEGEVVFICIDVEANERSASQITEIGIATLDTRDLKSLVPGECGANWRSQIRARHFRINEYRHVVNRDFVTGCPDKFEFGESEFINIKDAPRAVANCFKHPFSSTPGNTSSREDEPKRSIILVGHGIGSDISYLKSIGYDVHNLSNLQEVADTALMWQALKRDTNPRNLGSILAELDIAGWHLHNAGNDAVYTLQAMMAIAIKQWYQREKRKEVKEQEKKARVEESIKEATQNAIEREEGWSSSGENSDGGAPVALVPIGTRKATVQQPKKGTRYPEGPWKNLVRNPTNDRSWQPPAASSNIHSSPSSDSWRHDIHNASMSTKNEPAERKSWVQGATFPGSTPTRSLPTPIHRAGEHIEQISWGKGPMLAAPVHTPSRSREVEDLVEETTKFTIDNDTPPPDNW